MVCPECGLVVGDRYDNDYSDQNVTLIILIILYFDELRREL